MTGQFGGPIAAALFVFWLAFAFFGFILAIAGLSALQNYIYKQDNVTGKGIQLSSKVCLGWVYSSMSAGHIIRYRAFIEP